MREQIDDLTNDIVDYIRDNLGLDIDSDKDDEVYSFVWETCLSHILRLLEQREN